MEVRGLYESINVILIKIPFGKGKNDHFRAKNWFFFHTDILQIFEIFEIPREKIHFQKSPEITGVQQYINDSKRIGLIVLPFSLHIAQYFVPEFVSLI